MLHFIKLDNYSSTPKYQQIFNSITQGIEDGNIEAGARLPSIPEICSNYDIAKKTVEKAYKMLKDKDIIEAVHGKGHYVKTVRVKQRRRIFLIFNKLSRHKKIIYDQFVREMGEDVAIDFYIYHNEYSLFREMITNPNHRVVYSNYVIIPHFLSSAHKAREIINDLPKNKLLILDKLVDGIEGRYPAVYQNFEQNIFDALQELEERILKYDKVNLVFPYDTYQPRDIIWGFQRFCVNVGIRHEVISDINSHDLKRREVYITLMEEDLVDLIKKTKKLDYQPIRDIGIISYNENPIKEILLNGITVISTDFEEMGRAAARQIIEGRTDHIENPFRVIVRNSL